MIYWADVDAQVHVLRPARHIDVTVFCRTHGEPGGMRQKKGGPKWGRGLEVTLTWSPVGITGDAGTWELRLSSEHQAELVHQEDQPHGSESGPVNQQSGGWLKSNFKLL